MSNPSFDQNELADRLFDRHYEELFGYLYRLTGDRQHAADVAEQTIAAGVSDRRVVAGDGRQRAWLYRIATDLALYGRSPRPLSSRLPWMENRDEPALSGQLPGASAWGQPNALEAALAALPVRERAPLLLFGRCGLALDEVALALGLPESRARTGLAAARQHLREAYERTVQS